MIHERNLKQIISWHYPFKYIFYVKIQFSVTLNLKSDKDLDPDPHGSVLVLLPGSGTALRKKAGSLSEATLKPIQIHNPAFCFLWFILLWIFFLNWKTRLLTLSALKWRCRGGMAADLKKRNSMWIRIRNRKFLITDLVPDPDLDAYNLSKIWINLRNKFYILKFLNDLKLKPIGTYLTTYFFHRQRNVQVGSGYEWICNLFAS
jgi:hypothetical protein